MINIKDLVYKKLSDELDNVTDIYPSNWGSMPAIQYTEEDNRVHEYCDDKETLSYVRYRIDIWHTQSTSNTAVAVDAVMAAFGFRRTSCGDVEDSSGLRHKQMRYEAVFDCNKEFIYHKD